MTFFVYKFIGSLVTPPGLFCLILILLGVFFLRKNHKGNSAPVYLPYLFFTLCFALYLLSIPATADLMLSHLESNDTPLPGRFSGRTAVIILSGGSFRMNNGELCLSSQTMHRLIEGWQLARKNNWPVVTCGGSIALGRYPGEGDIMARHLKRWGGTGPVSAEGRSRTTWENLMNVHPLLQEKDIENIVLVTSAFHMRRSLWVAKKLLKEIRIYPYNVGTMANSGDLSPLDFVPSAGDLRRTALAWKEEVGLLAYRIFARFTG